MSTKMIRRHDFLVEQLARRKRDAAEAITRGDCMMDLAKKWGVSRPCVSVWCGRNLSEEDRRTLRENGHARGDANRATFDSGLRLELISLCRHARWSDARISRAIGISPAGLCQWLKHNAPDGVDDALADYRDDDAPQPQSAAA